MKHKFKLPTTDRLLGISAMITSILSLIVFTFQTHFIYKTNKLSVKPSLYIAGKSEENDTIYTIKYFVTNKGLGPAIIQSSTLSYQNEDYPLGLDDLFMKKFPLYEEYHKTIWIRDGIIKGTILSKNDTLDIYRIELRTKDLNKIPKNYYYSRVNDIKFGFTYSSIFEDDIWYANSDPNEPIIEK